MRRVLRGSLETLPRGAISPGLVFLQTRARPLRCCKALRNRPPLSPLSNMQDHSAPFRMFALFAILAIAACLTKPKAAGEQVTLSVVNVYDDKADNGLKGT